MAASDQTICALLAAHDEKGMEHLFDKYYKPLVVWAAGILNHVMQAEDVVQDFFIRLWERQEGRALQAETLRSFLYTSVRNLALDRLEKKDPLRHAADVSQCEWTWEEYDTREEEMLARVRAEIAALPERSRAVMDCIYAEGLSYKATAERLGVSVATVNTLLVNAVKKIRKNCSGFRAELLVFLRVRRTKTAR